MLGLPRQVLIAGPQGAGWCGRKAPVPREDPVGHPGWVQPLGRAAAGLCLGQQTPCSATLGASS